MEGEMTLDIRITCAEQRKISRTVLIIEAWSEQLDTATLVIEEQDLDKDQITNTKVEVPLNQLIHALEAVRMVLRA
jgi:DNA primase large subunit